MAVDTTADYWLYTQRVSENVVEGLNPTSNRSLNSPEYKAQKFSKSGKSKMTLLSTIKTLRKIIIEGLAGHNIRF